MDSSIETQLCYELKTFLLAGHETSAAMLMWSVFELSQNEAARKKVRSGESSAAQLAQRSSSSMVTRRVLQQHVLQRALKQWLAMAAGRSHPTRSLTHCNLALLVVYGAKKAFGAKEGMPTRHRMSSVYSALDAHITLSFTITGG